MFFIQVLQVDFLADFQFTQVYTGLLFLPADSRQRRCNEFLDDEIPVCTINLLLENVPERVAGRRISRPILIRLPVATGQC